MELEFYSSSLEETKQELERLQRSGGGGSGAGSKPPIASGNGTVDINEYNSMKMKWRQLIKREADLVDEIDRLKQQHTEQNFARGIKNVLDRSKSRGRLEGGGTSQSNGFGASTNNNGTG